jgi:thiosulfate dehydrogenase
VSCATCHDVGSAPPSYSVGGGRPGRIMPGYDLYDVVYRGSWWGGYEVRLLDAINVCLVQFMGGRALTAEEEQARALYEYLEAHSPDNPSPPLPWTIVKDVTDLRSLTGDATAGRDVYDRGCRSCHGAPRTGAGRLGAKVAIIPEDTVRVFGANARAVTVEKVRHGRFFNIGGTMAPYSAETLGDQEIADILAYLGL